MNDERCPFCYLVSRMENEELTARDWYIEVLEASDFYSSHGWDMSEFGCVEFELIKLHAKHMTVNC